MLLFVALLIAGPSLPQDTVRVKADSAPVWGASFRPVQTLLIGETDGPPEKAFGSIANMAQAPKGEFVLFDRSDTQMRRYSAEGAFLGLIGRSGGGPGEYRSVDGLSFIGDSLLLVWDASLRRATIYSATGEYRRSFLVQGALFGGDNSFRVLPGGRFMVLAPRGTPMEGPGSIRQYLIVTLDGKLTDSIALPAQHRDGDAFVLMTGDGARWNFPQETLADLGPTAALATGHSSRLGFTLRRPDGKVLSVDRPAKPLPLEGAERAQWQAWLDFMAPQSAKKSYSLPRVKPLVRAMRVDGSERVWLEVYAPAGTREPKPRPPGDKRPQFTLRDATTFEVFDGRGRYLSRVELPAESELLAIVPNGYWVLQHGEDGQEQVARYRLP